jgi:hypothetical protein
MSTFNKLFTEFVLAAALLVLGHTGMWAWRSARSNDAAQRNAIAPVIAMTSNGTVALPSSARADSCANTTHASAR